MTKVLLSSQYNIGHLKLVKNDKITHAVSIERLKALQPVGQHGNYVISYSSSDINISHLHIPPTTLPHY